MYWRLSAGFLIASIVQAATILSLESLDISNLGLTPTLAQLVLHVVVGQAAGYLLYYLVRNVKTVAPYGLWLLAVSYGVILWAVVMRSALAVGLIASLPWLAGTVTMLGTLSGFIVYSLISAETIRRYSGIKI